MAVGEANVGYPVQPRPARVSSGETAPIRNGTVQAFQSETHSELNELENTLTRLETQLVSVMSPPPPAGKDEATKVGGACEVAQNAHSAALRTQACRERVEMILTRLQIA